MQQTNYQTTREAKMELIPGSADQKLATTSSPAGGFEYTALMLLAGKYGGFVRVSVKLCCESSGTRPSRGWKMGEQQSSRMKVRH